MKAPTLASVARAARACTLCAAELPLGPRPVFRLDAAARLLIVGQAPGTKVHETGIPWNDRSGDRLREWLQLDRECFYDRRKIAILPMGLCYPGVDANGGDRPPPIVERCTSGAVSLRRQRSRRKGPSRMNGPGE